MTVEDLPAVEADDEAALRALPHDLAERAARERETARRLTAYLDEHHPASSDDQRGRS